MSQSVPGFLTCPIRCRWAVNASDWDMSDTDSQYLLSLLPSEERAECTRFHWPEDEKRALVSRLLQRLLGSLAFHVPFSSVQISRSGYGKPFFLQALAVSSSLNFNVAHDVRFQLCLGHIKVPPNRPVQTASHVYQDRHTEYIQG